jgi:hypothetical protein
MKDDDEMQSNEPIGTELTKRLLLLQQREGQPKRITNETAKAASELLRIFIMEARSRASIEVSTIWRQILTYDRHYDFF